MLTILHNIFHMYSATDYISRSEFYNLNKLFLYFVKIIFVLLSKLALNFTNMIKNIE